jgi:hypothetical protein
LKLRIQEIDVQIVHIEQQGERRMAIVHIDFRTISWGGPNEDDNNDIWEVEDGSSDPGEIVLEDFGTVGTPISLFPAPDTLTLSSNTYHRVFWDVTDGVTALDNFPSTAAKLSVPNMSGVLQATCWYVLPGGGGGHPALRARTFDADLNNFRKETPIASATPAGAWPGPNNHSVSTASADATAKAKDTLTFPAPFQVQPPGEPPKYFRGWLPVTPELTADPAPGKSITCKAKSSGLALGVYGHRKPAVIGGPALYQATYDYWAEYWGRRGAEGEGPFGPRGPGEPWGPLTQKWLTSLSPAQQQTALGYLAAKVGARKSEILP